MKKIWIIILLSVISLASFAQCDADDVYTLPDFPYIDYCEPCEYSDINCDFIDYIYCLYYCPLVVDLGDNGFTFGGQENLVFFNQNESGDIGRMNWVLPGGDEAFLARDLNQNGMIDHGGELFGNGTTILADGTRAANGFVALMQYDEEALGGNGDFQITSDDQVWSQLRLWLDHNGDAICTPDEVYALADAGFTAFALDFRESQRKDKNHNWLRFHATAKAKAHSGQEKTKKVLDIYFRRAKEHY